MRHLRHTLWLGLVGLAFAATPNDAAAWGNGAPIPINVDSLFIYRFDVKVGPSAFARPAGPWYTYFPADPYLAKQPQYGTFPNWPAQPSLLSPASHYQHSAPDLHPGMRAKSFYTP